MYIRFKGMFLVLAVFFVACLSMLFGTKSVMADTTYIVRPGDSLWKIAQTHHVSIDSLEARNHLSSDLILISQRIVVPTSASNHSSVSHPIVHHLGTTAIHPQKQMLSYKTHRVQAGDTLWALASAYHISVQEIKALNHLSSDTIYVGQHLRVFAGTPAVIRQLTFQRLRRTGMPLQLLPVYQAAGQKYGIPWKVLAAIHRVETDFSTGYEVSSAGAEGPMQFMPSTFRIYGVAAPGHDGAPDINNVEDAIYSCAHLLAADGYSHNPYMALFAYNHSDSYVRTVEQVAGSM